MTLYPFQQKVIDQTKDRHKVAYYLDMGLGKTFVGSEKAQSLGKKTLIVCQKSKLNDWIEHYKNQYQIEPYDLTDKNKLTQFISADEKSVGIINYDLTFRRPQIEYIKDITLMLDESSCIQNTTAKRTKAIMKLYATNIILLSGTPVSGKMENLYSQAKLLGLPMTKKDYEDRYINFELIQVGGMYHKIPARNPTKRYKNIDELKTKLRQLGAIFMKSDEVIDLPKQNFQKIKINRDALYNKFLKEKIITVGGKEFVGDTQLTAYLYKRQICSYLNKDKLNAFKDLIESTNDRLIVFYNWTNELKALLENTPKERPISIVNGKIKDLKAYEENEDSITYIQYQAGAMGLNLQKANKIVYFSPTDKSELYEQSKKRIHRIGQKSSCFYYQLVVINSIEEKIYRSLAEHKDYTDYLFKEDQENEEM